MAQYVYTMQGVTKVVPPQRTILQNINLSFYPGAKIGVLGLNGSGKSSLLRIMAGQDTEIDGEARAQKDIRVGYLPQEPGLDDDLDVRGNVELGVAPIMATLKEYNEISDRFAEPMDDDEMTKLLERQGDLATEIDAVDGWEIDRTLDIAADALRLPAWDTPVASLSGGERRRVALCALLLSKPDMLLLDEPTNHLDAESVSWLERFLDEYSGTVVAVTHDRYFLDNVASWILELDRGRGLPYEGNYSTWLEAKEKRLEQEASTDEARQRTIKSELEWVRSNPKARQAKSKSRMARFDELVAEESEVRRKTSAAGGLGDLRESEDRHHRVEKMRDNLDQARRQKVELEAAILDRDAKAIENRFDLEAKDLEVERLRKRISKKNGKRMDKRPIRINWRTT